MYTLELTKDEVETIAFVGSRYGWSDKLSHFDEGENELAEREAWAWYDAVNADAEGGHALFPMLDSTSELALKLLLLYGSVV